MARRTKEDAQATRTALLDAAERIFHQRGVSRTSLSDIAQAAGVTRGAVYWHFKDKAALFNAMMERVTLSFERMLPGAEESDLDQGDPIGALREGMTRALHLIAHDEQTRRVFEIATFMVEHIEELGAVRERHLEAQSEHIHRMGAILTKAAQERGMALPKPADQLARAMHAVIHGLIFNWLLQPAFDLEEVGLDSLDVFLRGIGLQAAMEELKLHEGERPSQPVASTQAS